MPRTVIVCQGRSCKQQGAIQVLETLRQLDSPDWLVRSVPCLGLCGNGPMVVVIPDNVWYWQVRPQEVAVIAEQHLRHGKAVEAMIYPLKHPYLKKSSYRDGSGGR